jgi:hypothetical protein
VKAIGPRSCDILTLSKSDLKKVEEEFEEMVSEIFLNSFKKIRKILKIKEENENEYYKKKAMEEATGTQMLEKDGNVPKDDLENVRRLATSLYNRSDSGAPAVGDNTPSKNAEGNYQKNLDGHLIRIDEEEEEYVEEDEEIHTDGEFYEAEAVWNQNQ